MQHTFNNFLQAKSQLSIDIIAARLFHICGSSRYLQESTYTTMPDICHIVDPTRAKGIFKEWTRLMLEEMDDTPKYISRLDAVYDTYFEEIYKPTSVRNTDTLFSMWCLFHMEKDMWFGFRNKHQNIKVPTDEINYMYYLPQTHGETLSIVE